jgi:hypothetical protein
MDQQIERLVCGVLAEILHEAAELAEARASEPQGSETSLAACEQLVDKPAPSADQKKYVGG